MTRVLVPVLASALALGAGAAALTGVARSDSGPGATGPAPANTVSDGPIDLGSGPDAPTHVDPAPDGTDVTKYVSTAELLRRSQAAHYTPVDETGTTGQDDPLRAGAKRHNETTAATPDVPTSEFTAAATAPAGPAVIGGLGQHTAPSCTGTGSDGARVQVIYAVEAGKTNRYSSVLGVIQQEVANVDDTFAVSARKTGGGRLVRWVTDGNCAPVVANVTVPAGTLGSDFNATRTALRNLGYNQADRKYVVFADANVLCGIGALWVSSSPSASNPNNGGNMHSRIDTGCWVATSQGGSIPAHELMHTLGAVQTDAPHATSLGHCTDDRDLMCYADGSGAAMTQTCAASQEALFDCNNDDYFSTAPAAGSYLATHWNTAGNKFLDAGSPVSVTSSAASVTTGTGFTVTAAAAAGSTYAWQVPAKCTATTATNLAAISLWCDKDRPALGPAAVNVTVTNGMSTSTGQAVVNVTLAPAPTGSVGAAPAAPINGQSFTVTATATGTGGLSYAWTTASSCLTSGTTAAITTYRCPADLITRTLPLQVRVTQLDGQSTTLTSTVVSKPSGATGPSAQIDGPGSVRAGLATTLTTTSGTPGVGWSWSLDQPCIIGSSTGSTLQVQCPASMTGTLTATATATSGAQSGTAMLQIALATDVAPMTATLGSSFATVYAGRDVVLTGTVRDGTRPVRASASIEASANGGGWQTVVAATDTGPTGTLSVRHRPTYGVATTYRLVVQTGPAWTVVAPTTTVTVGDVATGLVLTTAPGSPSTLMVRLLDGTGVPLTDRDLQLQTQVPGSGWVTLPRTYRTTGEPLVVGVSPDRTTSYRFVFRGTAQVAASTSGVVTVTR